MTEGRTADVQVPYCTFWSPSSLVWQIPWGHPFPRTPDFPPKQWRLRGLGPKLWSSHNSLKSQRGSRDFYPKGVSALLFPRRTEPSHLWKWVNCRAKQFSPGCRNRYSTSHFAALPRNTGNEKCINVWCAVPAATLPDAHNHILSVLCDNDIFLLRFNCQIHFVILSGSHVT